MIDLRQKLARRAELRYGFLFLPGAIAAGFVVAALVIVQLDHLGGPDGVGIGFEGNAQGARTILATVAGSLITVTGVTFSVTVVSLQLVSQQFSPRAIRTFLGDRVTQVTAGVLVGTFAYCLLVLRSVRAGGDFVPSLSISAAIALGVLSMGVLLVFIHHMSTSIQVSTITGRVSRATLASVRGLYPEFFGGPEAEDPEEVLRGWNAELEPQRVYPTRPGYVRYVGLDVLRAELDARPLRVHVPVAPGDFVTEAEPIMELWVEQLDGELEESARAAVVVGDERDVEQDAGYGVRQLADIAMRAISPSVNDPTTARTCLGYLRAILERLAGRAFPASVRRFDDDVVLVVHVTPFEQYVDSAFAQVGSYASDARVAADLIDATAAVARAAIEAGAEERLAALQEAAVVAAEAALDGAKSDFERRRVAEALARFDRAAGYDASAASAASCSATR
ncbi:MAG TPA: DUF2254 domain-containing protein [Gaiellaceae bacterium]|nr:DUF2254 domain-containing protein [Gaiellaceae bacterium]